MARTEQLQLASGRIVIHVKGLRELSRALSDFADKEVPKLFAREMREAGEDLARSAQGHAMGFSDTTSFAASIGVTGGRSGIFLRSTDPGAGTIEFAGSGAAVTVPAHTRAGFPVKAYTRQANLPGDNPRALFAAINDDLPELEARIGEVVERMAQAVLSAHEVK